MHSDQLSDGTPAYDYSGLLEELATVTRQEIRLSGSDTTFPKLTTPTPLQQRAFSLLGLPIALWPAEPRCSDLIRTLSSQELPVRVA